MRQTRVIAMTTMGIQKRMFWIALLCILSLITLYGYFVSKSITNVLLREETEQNIARINSELSELEFDYLTTKNAITLEFAQAKGFHTIKDKVFVARKSYLGRELSLNPVRN